MGNPTGAARTSFPRAVEAVLDHLETHRRVHTVSSLARDVKLNRRTVEKAVELILKTQHFVEQYRILLEGLERVRMLRIIERGGLSSLPSAVQKMVIRTLYFPNPSREQELLTHLLLRGATGPKEAVKLPGDRLGAELEKAGHIAQIDGRFYLTRDGRRIAEGTLSLYPELKETRAFLEET